jgi:hypothetical protein
MAITQEVIPNFIGGVSQQPDKLKYPNQAKELLNMLPDPTIGLSKRKPTEHIGRLMDVLPIQPKVYTVNKETEKYQVFLTGSTIRVFDLEGNEKTVNFLVSEGATTTEKENINDITTETTNETTNETTTEKEPIKPPNKGLTLSDIAGRLDRIEGIIKDSLRIKPKNNDIIYQLQHFYD